MGSRRPAGDQKDKDTAGTHVLPVPASCLLPPASIFLLLLPALLLLLLLSGASTFLAYRSSPRLSAVTGTGTLSVCRHPPTCSLALLALDYRIPILHLDTVLLFLFCCLFNRKHTHPQHLVLLTHSLPATYPIALSDSNSKAHSTVASISARLSACRASSILILFCPPSSRHNNSTPTQHELQKEGPFEGIVASNRSQTCRT